MSTPCPICGEHRNHSHSDVEFLRYANSAAKRIAELEQRWIPCSVRLPDDMQEVLISDGKVVGHARKRTNGWEIVASNDFIGNLGVTHWHHLPPPPIEVPE